MGLRGKGSGRKRHADLTHRNADKVNGHEEEVDVGPDRLDAYWPHLRRDDGADGAARGREVQATRADRCWEDLHRATTPLAYPQILRADRRR